MRFLSMILAAAFLICAAPLSAAQLDAERVEFCIERIGTPHQPMFLDSLTAYTVVVESDIVGGTPFFLVVAARNTDSECFTLTGVGLPPKVGDIIWAKPVEYKVNVSTPITVHYVAGNLGPALHSSPRICQVTIIHNAEDQGIGIFLDGDAVPIGTLAGWCTTLDVPEGEHVFVGKRSNRPGRYILKKNITGDMRLNLLGFYYEK